jgi:hypothetical protein
MGPLLSAMSVDSMKLAGQGTDMVDSCQEKKVPIRANCFQRSLSWLCSKATHRGAASVATVDHSDIRGLVTA